MLVEFKIGIYGTTQGYCLREEYSSQRICIYIFFFVFYGKVLTFCVVFVFLYINVNQVLVIRSVKVNAFLDLHKYEKLARHCYYVERFFNLEDYYAW